MLTCVRGVTWQTAAESAADAMRQKTDSASSEVGTLQRLLADAQATLTARDALVKELEAERSQLVTELTELRHQTDSKAAQAAQAGACYTAPAPPPSPPRPPHCPCGAAT